MQAFIFFSFFSPRTIFTTWPKKKKKKTRLGLSVYPFFFTLSYFCLIIEKEISKVLPSVFTKHLKNSLSLSVTYAENPQTLNSTSLGKSYIKQTDLLNQKNCLVYRTIMSNILKF